MRAGFALELHADATCPLVPHLKHVIARSLAALLACSTGARFEFSEFAYGGSACATGRRILLRVRRSRFTRVGLLIDITKSYGAARQECAPRFTRPSRELFACHAGTAVFSSFAHALEAVACAATFELVIAAAAAGACSKRRDD